MKKLLLVPLLAGLFFVIFSTKKPISSVDLTTSALVNAPLPSVTPNPFAEMTIPGLRERGYKSILGEQSLYRSYASYDSYLTSFNSDGLKINGLLTIPKGAKPNGGWPAIVFVHGYIPPSIYKTTEKYADYINYLAKNGFVVFKIDLRGHDKSEGEPSGSYYSGGYVIDTLNAYAALQNSDLVNPFKVGLWGHSMAGNITFRSFVAKQNIPALVIWSGAVYSYDDMAKYSLNDNSYRPPTDRTRVNLERQKLREINGNFSTESPFWKTVVPTNYLDGVSGAIEIHHAINDPVVNIGYSRDLMSILKNTKIQNQLYEYSNGGHNIDGDSFGVAMQRTIEFFKRNL